MPSVPYVGHDLFGEEVDAAGSLREAHVAPGDVRQQDARARDALLLCGVYGYEHSEAAGMLGIAVGTCKAQLHRARGLLRERLERGVR